MTVTLRDRLFSDIGGAVQGATVQAYLVTGGGTDAGTSSALSASTTTDVNGVWKFTSLSDPGAGNWYDVKIINGQQVRWRYGNIQALINQALLNSGVAVSGGALQVTFGTTVTKAFDVFNGASTELFYVMANGTVGVVSPTAILQLGPTNPAGAGIMRTGNNQSLNWRNAGNTNDHSISWGADDAFHVAQNLSDRFVVNGAGAKAIGTYQSANAAGSTTVAAGAGLGTSPPAPTLSNASDMAGLINIGTGTSPTFASPLVTVSFSTTYPAAPRAVLLCNANAAGVVAPYAASLSTTGFTVNSPSSLGSGQAVGGYQLYYVVMW